MNDKELIKVLQATQQQIMLLNEVMITLDAKLDSIETKIDGILKLIDQEESMFEEEEHIGTKPNLDSTQLPKYIQTKTLS